ncbi:S9 family peptidase [bacterium (Candidatus Blackallbacteria) CG17_big_fil_post_rev_8_21_14_2_50_48_46]|uniref:S9 family peptidase n=1 Tax=bacterium (Candidatus Blackallbacteria) CG17_big_fil_post_rev_8_21_14_2_50_48_46 TaxID=2014261 RepID=A0A2M7G2T6_9BACT|nr:MAG: S9 family peptidase [bacterium (Candidatus Blackallbacteria) CG18_big_fil_WC_8_21_14_2_50_49_26]PIW16035.1 MAG: S9 family peptidase [bacterium (Candidatus Blackallbacteria) CG17_big_fil_post_rev_8_21_14_2_50_48_46]PIW50447.1 MAG: S9 family peptidase [bacterium (Candidatus Blackallbacteria) CG13_big_fil_rev_8_21_14_2_50_49_14]
MKMTPPPLIPRKVLFGNPEHTSPQISPDGTRIAYLAPQNGILNVWVRSLKGGDEHVVTQDTERGIRLFFWAQDSRHVLYLQDKGGNENWRLYGIDLITAEIKDYTPFENVQAQVLQRDKHFPDELLIALNRNNPQLHDVYHLRLSSGALELRAENPGNFIGWVADAQFEIRAAVAANSDGSMQLLCRKNNQSDWEAHLDWPMEDSLTSNPSHFSQDGQFLYLLESRNANTARLVKYQPETHQEEILAEDPEYDIVQLMVHPDTYEVQALAYARALQEWQVLDPEVTSDFEFLSKFRPGEWSMINRDDANQTWLIRYNRAQGPVEFYAYDRARQEPSFLFVHQPALNDYTLAAMEPFSIMARDGLKLEGYISWPPGMPRENLPMVLNVHGGPWWRDVWGYHPEAQWLANRGYACLQLNYRGSTGYGKRFLNAGDREWGGKMHTDLLDAVEWAVSQGVARDKIAIYGGSYGGYAALVGATFTPDVFACAIDMVGPSSLITLIRSFPPYWAAMLDNFKKRVGDPDQEEEFLKSRSPLFKVDAIQIPMMIAQGANDPRVTVQEAEQIVAAMQEKKIPHEYLLFEDEGHGLAKPENRLKFYAAMEAFLATCLGGRSEDTQT